jgi:hypothetical protein
MADRERVSGEPIAAAASGFVMVNLLVLPRSIARARSRPSEIEAPADA